MWCVKFNHWLRIDREKKWMFEEKNEEKKIVYISHFIFKKYEKCI